MRIKAFKRKVVKRRVVRKPKITLAIKKYVKKTLSANLENKIYFRYGANQTISNASSGNIYYINLVPELFQGVNVDQRIGNNVKVVKANITGYVNILPYNATTNPTSPCVMIKLWLCSYKSRHNTNFTTLYNERTDFFDIGNTNIGFQGNMLDTILTCNKQSWTWHKTQQFKLGASNATTAGPVGTSGYYDNSPMTHKFSFDFAKHLGVVKFNENSAQSSNKNLFLVFQCVYADGSMLAAQASEFHSMLRIEYEDA